MMMDRYRGSSHVVITLRCRERIPTFGITMYVLGQIVPSDLILSCRGHCLKMTATISEINSLFL